APRRHAVRDALRHKSTLHRAFRIGRRASRNAFPRRAWGRSSTGGDASQLEQGT
ncbi:DUF1534 domain-containing protein, partial [Pseudomonas syringae pv. actinidiae]|nr:DUF1534 domain-containing protein [Pseudomonas syringae pv. actinidiae]